MSTTDISRKSDFETGIARRMDALIARKRDENELAIARIATLDTAWKDVNGDIDKDLKAGLDTVRIEAQAIRDAKERLTRSVCDGVDKNAFGLAGKVVDVKSKTGLPGLTVKIALTLNGAEQNVAAESDNYGDFFFSFSLEHAVLAKSKQSSLLIVVLFGTDTVVYREQRALEPKAGAVEHLTIAIECSGKLKDVLDHGEQLAASLEGDAKLVEARAANLDAAYSVFQSLSETTLAQLRRLKKELSVAPPQTVSECQIPGGSAASVVEKMPLLGNSHVRELHDLNNVKKQCQIDGIAADHRVYFRSEREAVKAGYDYCAYCFGRNKSKR